MVREGQRLALIMHSKMRPLCLKLNVNFKLLLFIFVGPEEDQDDPDQPYCKGVYIVISGSIDVIYKDEKCFTLNNGDSFGESLIIKQPVSNILNNFNRVMNILET